MNMSIYSLLLLSQLMSSLLYSWPVFSSANSITLPLSRVSPQSTNNNNPLEILKHHAAASLSRAQHHLLKRSFSINVPLSPHSYSEYTVPLSFGTPLQTLSFIVDTGSSPTWFPCTFQNDNYTCTNCPFPGAAHIIPAFITKKSSSYKTVPCQSTQCEWLSPDSYCNKDHTKCVYRIEYGSGNTTGLLLNETMALMGSVVVDNFTVGCSVSSARVPEVGIVGFGRDPESLPAQMGLTSFSHCLVSHDFDDNPSATGDLVLTTGDDKGAAKFNYTPFLTNPRDYSEYYYVGLQSISVGRVDVKVPDEHVVPNATGYGGTIVDSGTSFTLMKKPVFDLVFKQLQIQVGNKYKRDKSVESQTGLEPCYSVSAAAAGIKLPQLTFTFQGGVEMVLPLPNYFSYPDDKNRSVLCMTIMSLGDEDGVGPAIILGNYLQQDYYIKYDLENKRLGIRKQICK